MAAARGEAQALVRVEVVEARDLLAADANGKSDPYVKLKYAGVEWRSAKIKRTLNPEWHEKCNMFITAEHGRDFTFVIEVWDWDIGKDDFLGSAEYKLGTLMDAGGKADLWLQLIEPKQKHVRTETGRVHVKFELIEKKTAVVEFFKVALSIFDFNRNGKIDLIDLTALVSAISGSLSSEEIAQLYSGPAADEGLSAEELCQWMLANPTLGQKVLPYPDYIWRTMYTLDTTRSVRDMILQGNGQEETERPGSSLKATLEAGKRTIHVKERETGQIVIERIPPYLKTAMRLMHANKGGKNVMRNEKIKALLSHLTHAQGVKYDQPESRGEISHFITYHNLNTEEILHDLDSFKSFNEFFYRKLKPEARPIAATKDPKVAVCPADCRLSAFTNIDAATRFWIKGEGFNLASLLQDQQLAREFEGGSIVINRLAPQDYHRFHSPVSGELGSLSPIAGTYYTVNPIAINESVDVFASNRRVVTWVTSPSFGKVCFIAVGAIMVGSVRFTVAAGNHVDKGAELGYFAFGGSTVILLFQPGKIKLDDDLVRNCNAEKPVETLVKQGNSLGKALDY
eukprot:TRINITY_DN5708_c0_g1_i1.p1 TRINITY_DN5708_c0_g1~~TRINITY_DN5708_c0_g1_i1.p1  ORF type:complete len:569 (-),score=105.04 TRINITY_DN5708_c0_g1_i1:1250-2956(-)